MLGLSFFFFFTVGTTQYFSFGHFYLTFLAHGCSSNVFLWDFFFFQNVFISTVLLLCFIIPLFLVKQCNSEKYQQRVSSHEDSGWNQRACAAQKSLTITFDISITVRACVIIMC